MESLKKMFPIIALLSIGLFSNESAYAGSFENGEKAKRVFILSDFNAVSVSSGIDLYLQPSSKTEAEATTSREMLNKLDISQSGGKVIIKLKKGVYFNSRNNIRVVLSYRNLNSINASGGSDIFMSNNEILKSNNLSILGSGGSDFNIKIDVESLDCSLSGGSDGKLSGSAKEATYRISGGSDLLAKELISNRCEINASGGSDAYIYATDHLKVVASGASDVYFFGNPKQRNIQASGASDIKSK